MTPCVFSIAKTPLPAPFRTTGTCSCPQGKEPGKRVWHLHQASKSSKHRSGRWLQPELQKPDYSLLPSHTPFQGCVFLWLICSCTSDPFQVLRPACLPCPKGALQSPFSHRAPRCCRHLCDPWLSGSSWRTCSSFLTGFWFLIWGLSVCREITCL